MSFTEKIDILGMRFENMWYRIWLNIPSKNYDIADVYNDGKHPAKPHISASDKYKIFFQKKNKFEKNFMVDKGKRLRELIINSSSAELIWEMPKGGKSGPETNIDCAIREFTEETCIPKHQYKVHFDVKPVIDTITENDTIYQHCYYLATLRDKDADITPKVHFNNFKQISEIKQIRWVALAEIEFLQLSPVEKQHLARLFKLTAKCFKNAVKPIASLSKLIYNSI